MIENIILKTTEFLENMPKSKRKKIGQFFTSKETAVYMANMFDLKNIQNKISILDPGAGTGILSVALIDRIIKENIADSIKLTCYENDPEVLPILKQNLQHVKNSIYIDFEFNIIEDDYLLTQAADFENTLLASSNPVKYDLIIGNPPYLRIMRNHPTAMALPTIIHGAPNYYFMFASMSLFNLKNNHEMVYIIPRSWTSGEYFKAFRNYFLTNGKLEHIHLFLSRDKVFSQEQVLQETIIIKVKKTFNSPKNVLITSSHTNNDFHNTTKIYVPYNSVVTGKNLYVYLPTNEYEVNIIQKINKYQQTLPEIGFRMRTGIVVDFRQRDELREAPGKDIVPLFYAQHIKDGRVNHVPSGKELDWISDKRSSSIQKNKNYIFVKRFTAKEERRRLQCGIYLATDFPKYKFIGTQNKINYVDRVDKNELSLPMTYGIYALLNSTLFDMYYRILNGSTQVNSTEINNIPVPPIDIIESIGIRLLDINDLSTKCCDKILKEVAYNE